MKVKGLERSPAIGVALALMSFAACADQVCVPAGTAGLSSHCGLKAMKYDLDGMEVGFCLSLGAATGKAASGRVDSDSMDAFKATTNEAGTIVLEWKGNALCGKGFTAKATLTPEKEGGYTYGFSYSGNKSGLDVEEISFPDMTVPRTDGTSILYPDQLGCLRRPVWESMLPGQMVAKAGPKNLGFCFAAAMTEGMPGVYVDTRGESIRHVKTYRFFNGPRPGTLRMTLGCTMPLGQDGDAKEEGALPYGGVVRRFSGDWYDAARIYRKWAEGTRWYGSARDLRRKSGRRVRDIGLWLWNRGPSAVVTGVLDRVRHDTGVPLALDWYWWHKIPYGAEAPYYWPPSEPIDKFSATIASLKKSGTYVQTYINGMCCDADDPRWKDGDWAETVVRRDGSYFTSQYNRFFGHRIARMCCGSAPVFCDRMSKLTRNLADAGVDSVYVDMVGKAAFDSCWSRQHDHPRGGGTHMADGYLRMIERLRRENPGLHLSSEEETEAFLGLFETQITIVGDYERFMLRTGPEYEYLPVYQAIYHEVAPMFGNLATIDHIPPWHDGWPEAKRRHETRDLVKEFPDQFAVDVARPIVFGCQPCVHQLLPKHLEDPRLARDYAFLCESVRFYYANRDLLFDGEMMSPGTLECATAEVPFLQRGVYTADGVYKTAVQKALPTVFRSVWRAPDGKVAAVLVNWSGREQKYRLSTCDMGERIGVIPPRSWVRISADDQRQKVVITRGRDWIPVEHKLDIEKGSALDFSEMGFTDAPAGKHGWLRNVGGHFEFEHRKGRPVRFYGVNLCGRANFPSHEQAELLVMRLKRLGYNAIRLHHHDAVAVEGSSDGLSLNRENMDRFDYLAATAIREGFYLTTDLFVSRKPLKWRDAGIDRDGTIKEKNIYKILCALHEPAFRNWARFAENFLKHRNPYTGRRYAEEPAMPLLSMINENGFFMGWNRGASEIPEVRLAWRRWLQERRVADPGFCPNADPDNPPRFSYSAKDGAAFAIFMGDMESRMFARMKKTLTDLGCRAMFTSDNCGPHYTPLMQASAQYDYVDNHFYVDHPKFLQGNWKKPTWGSNMNPVLMGNLPPCLRAFARMLDKPYTVSEWNFCGPNQYRSVGGLMTGSLAALQDWDGMWRFAYAHDLSTAMGCRESSPGYFSIASDPLSQASDRACIMLFLRQDMKPFAKDDGVAMIVTPESVCPPTGRSFAAAPSPGEPNWADAPWRMRVGTCLSEESACGLRCIPRESAENPGMREFARRPNSSDKVAIDGKRGTFVVNTPRTCGGFAPCGEIRAGTMTATIDGTPATVWVSSLDKEPLAKSGRILLTHLTDVQGEGTTFLDEKRTTLLKFGRGVLVRNGTARVTLSLADPCAYAVYGLDTSGHRAETIPTRIVDGRLEFTASVEGHEGARMIYEIVR